MGGKGDLLIGRIALREGLVSREQLYDCLTAQERNPAKSLGSIMVSRGYLKNEDVERLLQLQRDAIENVNGRPEGARGALLGKILIEKGLATEYQVNECLRLQARLADLGIAPLPPLGEILVKRRYLKKDAVETALHLQNLTLYSCPECGAPISSDQEKKGDEDYICGKCNAEVPLLFAKMAATMHEALDEASKEHDQDLPADVRLAKVDPANRFGKYVLLNEIGRGGAGIVYRAWQMDLNKVVALKLLPHESDTAAGVRTPYGDAEDVKRFFNETRAAAELNHSNIVPILDFGSVENHFFYTMHYIEGVTLDGLVREGIDESVFQTTFISHAERYVPSGTSRKIRGKELPVKLAAALMRDVCRAIHYAHERGVYHRDLKPSNIIIDRSGRPWVMDFGLAKVARIGDSAYVKGVIMGTPYYMPPELAEGDMEKVDHLSDVYSLGAVLYEAVTGISPYND
ncbi:MAG: protein kinase, partial [Planctomycetes bacterium]|nr:protein kinase [Planctomycetota bacterium]